MDEGQIKKGMIPSIQGAQQDQTVVYASPRGKKRTLSWSNPSLLIAFALGPVLQYILLPLAHGTVANAALAFTILFDVLILARVVYGLVCKEGGRSWLFYLILLYTSPIWIILLMAWLAKISDLNFLP